MQNVLRRNLVGLAISSLILVILLNLLFSTYQNYARHPLCEGELRTVDWSGRNLEGIDCSHQVMREAQLSNANLRRANLQATDLSGATYMEDTDLRGANLTQAKLVGTSAIRADFSSANLTKANLSHANLSGARFNGADLTETILIGARLVAADLRNLRGSSVYLDRSDLTDARLDFPSTGIRLCNTIMPSGNVSKEGCFAPSYEFRRAADAKLWGEMDQTMGAMFWEAFSPTETGASWSLNQITPAQIRSMPCHHLSELDRMWREASGDRFGFSIQRRIWTSPEVNQDYNKFGEAVGWKQNGTWLKFDGLPINEASRTLPEGIFPWYRWQVQEPTSEEPTRFRRVGFGDWMNHLEACGL